MNVMPSNQVPVEADTNSKIQGQISEWIQLTGAELADPKIFQNFPSVHGRDLAPLSNDPSNPLGAPGDCYAVGIRQDGLPVDVIDYASDQTDPTKQCDGKLTYQQQFLFSYDQSTSPTNVSIQQWQPADTDSQVDQTIIGTHNHSLISITQYELDAQGNPKGAQFYTDSSLHPQSFPDANGKVTTQAVQPDISIVFTGDNSIQYAKKGTFGNEGLLSGMMPESGAIAESDLQTASTKDLAFYDLFAGLHTN